MKHLNKFNEAKQDKQTKLANKQAKQTRLTELKSKIKDFEDEFGIIVNMEHDYKQISNEVYKDIEKVVKGLDGYMYNNPYWNNSDMISIIVSKKPINKERLSHFADLYKNLSEFE